MKQITLGIGKIFYDFWNTSLLVFCIVLSGCSLFSCAGQQEERNPNIIYILADDMGYGDVSAFNSESAWKTPRIDRLAEEGMIFTDAHTNSSVCSPTRYGVLTGRYAWRSRLKQGVLWSWDKPLIETSRMTVGQLLQNKGYSTACIGKWHLGLEWQFHNDQTDSADFSKPVTGGPAELGFNYFYGITASLDIPPYVYIENNQSTTVPVKYTENKDAYGWWRKGLTGDDFDHDQVLPVLTEKVVSYIDSHMKVDPATPFFIYFALPAPHTPILPTEEFQGKSGTNPYGDFVLQVDWTVGQVVDALERNGISDQTLIIFTSDNGCSPQAKYDELAAFGHNPSYKFRGTKADIFEGGHRVPYIVRWPGIVKAGSVSEQVVCLTDLIATTAAIVGDSLPPDAGPDSYNMLPAMMGEATAQIREATVHHSINGSFAIRKGKWKLIMCPGSGGWSYPRPGTPEEANLAPIQLYDLENDIGEMRNMQEQYPEITLELKGLLKSYIMKGRSTPGSDQEFVISERWPGTSWIEEFNSSKP